MGRLMPAHHLKLAPRIQANSQNRHPPRRISKLSLHQNASCIRDRARTVIVWNASEQADIAHNQPGSLHGNKTSLRKSARGVGIRALGTNRARARGEETGARRVIDKQLAKLFASLVLQLGSFHHSLDIEIVFELHNGLDDIAEGF